MNRKAIRDLASKELTADYRYATTAAELRQGVEAGMPCVVKPLMSSSEKDSPLSRQTPTLRKHGNMLLKDQEVMLLKFVEAFVKFNSITLLTVVKTTILLCAPIGTDKNGEIIKKAGSLQQF
jgi:formate-dependent phosphoribosylglycinamide formyltransferase (GAR transformylase)